MTSLERYRAHLDRLEASLRILPDKPEETAERTLRALVFLAAGRPCSSERAAEESLVDLDAEQERGLESLIEARLGGTPLGHLTGWQRFMGLELQVGSEALIPRKETEILACAAAELLAELFAERGAVTAGDVCTGAGNVALALASRASSARVIGADLSEAAISLARRNAEQLGLSSRVEFRVGDLCAPLAVDLRGRLDLLTCNPPYISSGKVSAMADEIASHEPSMAFDGGPFGVSILNRFLKEAPPLLKPRSWAAFEVGLNQGPGMVQRLERGGIFQEVRALPDEGGEIRAIMARTGP